MNQIKLQNRIYLIALTKQQEPSVDYLVKCESSSAKLIQNSFAFWQFE